MIALEAQATAHGQSSQEKELAVKKNSAKDAALRARTASRALQGLDTSVRSAENPLPPSPLPPVPFREAAPAAIALGSPYGVRVPRD